MARVRGRWLLLCAVIMVWCAGCANAMTGTPDATPIPVVTLAQSIRQSMADLAESGVLHYTGSLVTSDNVTVGFTLNVTQDALVSGTLSAGGQQAAVLVVAGLTYLNGPGAFWTALTGQDTKDAAVAGYWLEVADDVIGVNLAQTLAPRALTTYVDNQLNALSGPQTLAQRSAIATTKVNGIPAIPIGIDNSTLDVAAAAPHGLLHADLVPPLGTLHLLSFDVSDASATEVGVYQGANTQSGQLATAIDPTVDITEGTQRWGACAAAGCTVVVTVTNNSYAPAKIEINGSWVGDGGPAGTCQTVTDAVPAGQTVNANCTDHTAAWTSFFNHANDTAGNHQYEVDWSAAALADQPDLAGLAADASASGAPAPDNPATTGDRYALYEISYQTPTSGAQPWRYGVAPTSAWRATADGQLGPCLGASQTSCAAQLLTTANARASLDALAEQLVAKAKTAVGHCPPGQWSFCD